IRGEAEQHDEQQPRRSIADTDCRHPETEREANHWEGNVLEREVAVSRGAGGIRGVAERPEPDGHRSHLSAVWPDLELQDVASPRLPKRPVVRHESVDRTPFDRQHLIAVFRARLLGLWLNADGAPVPVAEVQRLTRIFVRVPNGVEAIERASGEVGG